MTSFVDCGDRYNEWVQIALEYLPPSIVDEHKDRLAFVAMGHRDGCRLAKALRENREIILLSERVLPKARSKEDHADVRYFIYVVLHEVAHAVKRHRSQLYDSLTDEAQEAQEREADDLALEWFNEHISAMGNPHLPPLTREDVISAQAKSQAAMDKLYRGA